MGIQLGTYMGVSENVVYMVLLIIIPFLNGYFIGNIPNIFRQTHLDVDLANNARLKQHTVEGNQHTVNI